MRRGYLLLALAALAVTGSGDESGNAGSQRSTNAPVLAQPANATPSTEPKEKSPAQKEPAPLLLLDDVPETKNGDKPMADNSRCAVCHLNMMQEDLAVKHAKAEVGCAKCHGACDAHIADESWASGGNGTPPEIMYPRDKIASGCLSCHKPEQVFVKSEKHKPDLWLIAYEKKLCTECHGKHRLVNRKCKWK
jgi:hypothetical protein